MVQKYCLELFGIQRLRAYLVHASIYTFIFVEDVAGNANDHWLLTSWDIEFFAQETSNFGGWFYAAHNRHAKVGKYDLVWLVWSVGTNERFKSLKSVDTEIDLALSIYTQVE